MRPLRRRSLVPGFTVHDSAPPGPNGATVPPRSVHADAGPPPPNGLSAKGVSSSVVHIAARLSSSVLFGTAPAAGAATHSVAAATSTIRTRRDMGYLPVGYFPHFGKRLLAARRWRRFCPDRTTRSVSKLHGRGVIA